MSASATVVHSGEGVNTCLRKLLSNRTLVEVATRNDRDLQYPSEITAIVIC